MRILGRQPARIAAALCNPSYYVGLLEVAKVFHRPLGFYYNYVFHRGHFPARYSVRTPAGEVSFDLYHIEDLLTANEIFARLDYKCSKDAKVIVDIGANIGLASLYFLTRSRDSFVYAFEPVPLNVERFRKNLNGFEDRYELAQQAVAVRPGTVDFGIEPTGRLGSLADDAREGSVSERDYQKYIKVSAVTINDALWRILDKSGQIDLLKVDVEGTEAELVAALLPEIRRKIERMHVEWQFTENPIADTHVLKQGGAVATFYRIAARALQN